MVASLIKYYVKGILHNKHIWFWGIAFAVFWLLLSAFELSQNIAHTPDAMLTVTSSWFGIVALFSLSSIAISIAYTIYYASSSLSFSFKYTKLTPQSFVSTLVGSSAILSVMLGGIVGAVTYGVFSIHFGAAVPASNLCGVLAVAALSGMFMMTFAMLLVLIAVNYIGLKSVTLIMMIPLILAFWLGDTQMYSNMPLAAIYASPYNSIQSLLYLAYQGKNVYAQLYNTATPALQWPLLVVSVTAWIAVLLAADIYLLRRLKPRQTEEARQI